MMKIFCRTESHRPWRWWAVSAFANDLCLNLAGVLAGDLVFSGCWKQDIAGLLKNVLAGNRLGIKESHDGFGFREMGQQPADVQPKRVDDATVHVRHTNDLVSGEERQASRVRDVRQQRAPRRGGSTRRRWGKHWASCARSCLRRVELLSAPPRIERL